MRLSGVGEDLAPEVMPTDANDRADAGWVLDSPDNHIYQAALRYSILGSRSS
jgi:hypothetical protein